ncbi:hypothetical protein WA026_013455 [Henosepilachna vigintioctopunctata]|uniref:Uncharacterized protein n=1 Tax=Henosepilachna vigintioctopunctata TaxID=420089 RepID=A0AAW1VG91_9CUCU
MDFCEKISYPECRRHFSLNVETLENGNIVTGSINLTKLNFLTKYRISLDKLEQAQTILATSIANFGKLNSLDYCSNS